MGNNNFDGEIKLEKWDKKIKINDNGDYIILHIGDLNLINNTGKMLEDISKKYEEIQKKVEEEQDNQNKIDMTISLSSSICETINAFFNDDSLCTKVFNTNTPYIDDIFDFIFQICELIEKFTGKKIDNLKNISNKYTDAKNKRLGARI